MNKELIAVPGGAGFIGSHLCERLIAAGYRVLALDDFSTGAASNLDALQGHRDFALTQVDIAQSLVPQVGEAARIFNAACPASPAHYQRNPVQTTLTSTLGTWRLLESVCRSRARFMQLSTSEVYGDPLVHPQPEDYWGNVNPIGERSCYDEGKRCAEALCFAYRRQYQTDIRVARLFNCYGPRLRPGDGRVVSNFIVQALCGQPLTVYGDGQQTRSFSYVDDTVDALLRLMDAPVDLPVNIGSPVEHTVLDLAEKVLRLTRSRSRLQRLPLPADDPQRRCPDITRARVMLGWAPRVGLEDGLRETIAYFRRELGMPARTVSMRQSAPAADV